MTSRGARRVVRRARAWASRTNAGLVAFLGVIAVFAGCARPDEADRAPAADAAADTPASLAVVIESDASPPPDSRLHLLLADTHDGEPRFLGEMAVRGPAFPLEADMPARIPEPVGQPVLHARLSSPDGTTWFETAAPMPVDPYLSGPASLRLTPRTLPEPGTAEHWQCEETGVAVLAPRDRQPAQVMVSGRWITAHGAPAGALAFRSAGNVARLERPGEPARDCTRTDRISPWYDAYARGMRVRAVGNEPGWYVEIGDGAAPSLHAVLDYGSRELRLPLVLRTSDGYAGRSPDGVTVRVRIEPGECRDVMSGERFEARVGLDVGGHAYRGCGANLRD